MNLILFTGPPASGKSTISSNVGKKLNIEVISKDMYKIQLFDRYGFKSNEEKKELSLKAEDMMYKKIKEMINLDQDLIVDNNFKNFNVLRTILKEVNKNVNVICIRCEADYSVLANRYNERIINKERHPSLYIKNCYPYVEGVSEIHKMIEREDVIRIENEVVHKYFGEKVLIIKTDTIDKFDIICNDILLYIERNLIKKYSEILNSKNPKVITMLSGGKDSCASIIKLKKNGVDVTAIHFSHPWTSDIPTEEAKKICNLYKIPLLIIDFTKEFCDAIVGYTSGRPCLICKKQMYKKLLEILNTNEYGWICIGDTASDKTTIARIKQFLKKDESLMFNKYFGSEMGMKLPSEMKVVRPLIEMSAKEVENFLLEENIVINRINSTGDKYFEYHREGCPVQFADIGVPHTKELFLDLKIYNDKITEYARSKGILASIHMPSTFIVTIPKGYEMEALDYLKKSGLNVDENINSDNFKKEKVVKAIIYEIDIKKYNSKVFESIFNRFLERIELYGKERSFNEIKNHILCFYEEEDKTFHIDFNYNKKTIDIQLVCSENYDIKKYKKIFENLIIELFRTRKYDFLI